jgi:NAD(P)-dependent dehydrogenase (short-subunit alcohol dehydrogenase family)
MELKDRRIRSNVLSPGPIKTPLVERQPPESIARVVATIRWDGWESRTKSPRQRSSWPQMIQVLSRASSCSSMVGEVKFDRLKRRGAAKTRR